jgi:hypothetical protein
VVIHCSEELISSEGVTRGGREEECEGVEEGRVHYYWENRLRISVSQWRHLIPV